MSCTNTQKKLCGACDTCFQRSFASHEKSHCWSDRNSREAKFVCKGSSTKFWFECECGHEFGMMMSNVNQGKWCPYCRAVAFVGMKIVKIVLKDRLHPILNQSFGVIIMKSYQSM